MRYCRTPYGGVLFGVPPITPQVGSDQDRGMAPESYNDFKNTLKVGYYSKTRVGLPRLRHPTVRPKGATAQTSRAPLPGSGRLQQ